MYRPSGFDSPSCVRCLPVVRQSAIGDFAESPPLPSQRPGVVKSFLRVLTSSENMRRIDESAKEKADKLKAKEERGEAVSEDATA